MKIPREKLDISIFALSFVLVVLIFAITMKALPSFATNEDTLATTDSSSVGQRFITIYDNGTSETLTIKTDATTVSEVLDRISITIDANDIVEPATHEPILSDNFRINIYRARPILVIDGIRQYKIMTATENPTAIASQAGIVLLDADIVKLTTSDNFLESGLPLAYTVFRAKTINFNFYGQALTIRTNANTIAEFLAQRNIAITTIDWLSKPPDTVLTENLNLSLYRQGKNTISTEEEVAFVEQITHDYTHNIGYRAISAPGKAGLKTVTYAVTMQDGQEVSREVISEIVTQEPITQLVTIGARAISMQPLTKSMGRNRYTTSTGILREETYYDLDMSGVMKIKQRECGGSTYYTVREDGAKVDSEGYILVAAQLSRYPRCSIVETSLGLGKVYDTGTFAGGNPEQFDLATDWTKRDGI